MKQVGIRDDPNLGILVPVVITLGELCDSPVFVGGCAAGLLITAEGVLGFHNQWYPLAVRSAERVRLPDGQEINLVSPPVFIASKIEAFKDRGNNDFLASHDLEDVISVIDG